MRQLTDMFKEVVGVEDGPQQNEQMKKMFSSSDLGKWILYVHTYMYIHICLCMLEEWNKRAYNMLVNVNLYASFVVCGR